MSQRVFPAEWAPQSAVLLAWPHPETDWSHMLHEVQACFQEIVAAIARFEEVILLVPDAATAEVLRPLFPAKVKLPIVETNDTWARDFGPISIQENGMWSVLDFKFNGWGLKFAADKDNLVTRQLLEAGLLAPTVEYHNRLNFVLEGGALESDGEGTLLTTAECLLSPNRNGEWDKVQIESYLKETLGAKRLLWLHHGYLSGDDTDSHIDTLARFCDKETIAYVQCSDPDDEHYQALQAMEAELKTFVTDEGAPYQLIALPMADEVIFDSERLPATYANFLIINEAVLVPTYNSPKDALALSQLKKAFPLHEIIGINCLPLIKQHGSLHCVTMQLPKGVTN
ncbi:MAG: agmatine deiminase family protein [Bacteroidales bacterium]|nr:agmatine deiminase family protein [Bacteroidales bacterium]